MKENIEQIRSKSYSDGYTSGWESARDYFLFWGTIFSIIILVASIFSIQGLSILSSDKQITVNSKIVDIDYSSYNSFYTIQFKNGDIYRINKETGTNNDMKITDFDKAENVIVELRYNSGIFTPNTDNCWGIVKIIKY